MVSRGWKSTMQLIKHLLTSYWIQLNPQSSVNVEAAAQVSWLQPYTQKTQQNKLFCVLLFLSNSFPYGTMLNKR